jgi:hypothetical protein
MQHIAVQFYIGYQKQPSFNQAGSENATHLKDHQTN